MVVGLGSTLTVVVGIPAKSAAAVFRGAPMAKVTGWMVIDFGSRHQGDYEWYAYPTLTVPAEDQPHLSRLVANTPPLTQTGLDARPDVPVGSKLQIDVPPAETSLQESRPPRASPRVLPTPPSSTRSVEKLTRLRLSGPWTRDTEFHG